MALEQPPMGMQPTGYGQQMPQQQQQQRPQLLQPQPTGMYQQNQSFNSLSSPQQFSSPPPLPIQFNPTSPASSLPAKSTTSQFEPSNVFASMKPGGFQNGTGPQESGRYDALRAQPTGAGALLSFLSLPSF